MFRKCKAVILVLVLVFVASATCFAETDGSRAMANQGIYSQWSSTPYNYQNFNCYGYAIGTNQNVEPGHYSGLSWSYYTTNGFNAFKNAIKGDLAALGYTSIREVSSSYSLKPGERLIAFVFGRWDYFNYYKGDQLNDVGGDLYNFHFFVKYTNAGGWFHKYGPSSTIMKLRNNKTPSNITITDEHYQSQNYCTSPYIYYSGSYYGYIVFQTGIPIESLEGEDA